MNLYRICSSSSSITQGVVVAGWDRGLARLSPCFEGTFYFCSLKLSRPFHRRSKKGKWGGRESAELLLLLQSVGKDQQQ
jgi:hypothetical protein